MSSNKTFVVYFEIFGSKKKYTVDNPNVKSQVEAEAYVRYVLIPNNTKFHNLSEKSTTDMKNEKESIEEIIDKISSGLNNWLNKLKQNGQK